MLKSKLDAEKTSDLTKDINIAKEILKNRLCQALVNEKYRAGLFKIPIHLAFGHEAIAVAVDTVLGENDQLSCSHRNIHYNLARAKVFKPILDEYFLKKEGLAQAQLGSMNLANEKKNLSYTSSILGNNLAVATGIALAQKIKKTNGLTIVVTGDGAMEEGTFYESLLFMKSNHLSGVILVENNGWSMHTSIPERRHPIDISKFTASMDIKYRKLSGNDVYLYIKQLEELREEVLKEQTPAVVEVELSTLGGWYVKNPDGSNGRFIHLHAGPTPEIKLAEWPEVEQSENDPVFVLRNYFEQDILKKMALEILNNLKEEIGES